MARIFCIIGSPISHTLSPLIHNSAFNKLNMDSVYVPFEVLPGNLEAAIKGIQALGITGANITVPHKESVLPYIDDLSEEAKLIGAVNTIYFNSGKLVGENTDGKGFIKSVIDDGGINPAGKSVLLLGAGGSARSIAVSLLNNNIRKSVVANRTYERGYNLVKDLNNFVNKKIVINPIQVSELTIDMVKSSDIIINTTTIGMNIDDPYIFDYEWITNKQLVCDIIYKPSKTELLKKASSKGAKTLNGMGMLIYQGALAFEIWTGEKMPVDYIREMFTNKLKPEL